jgi:predicted secreted protein
MKLRGDDVILFFEVGGKWRTLAYGTTCEIDIAADTEEGGSALSGRWKSYKKRRIGGTISSGHLMADAANEVDALALVEAGTPINVNFATVAHHALPVDAADYVPDERLQLQGAALVERVTITARRGDYVTMSVSLRGVGKLTKIKN